MYIAMKDCGGSILRRSLALALQGFEGALVIVSHDRSLIANCADRILVVAGGRVASFDGDLEDYRRLRVNEERATRPAGERPSRKDERRASAEARDAARAGVRPLQKAVTKIEARIAALERDAAAARDALADPALYEGEPDRQRIAELGIAQTRLAAELAAAEDDWLHASARLEAAKLEAAGDPA